MTGGWGRRRLRAIRWAVVLGAAAVIGWEPAKAADLVKIAADDSYPPYSYVQNGAAAGIYPKILQAVFSGLPQYRLQIFPMPWKRGLQQTQEGEFLGILAPYRRQSRPWMAYSAPLYQEKLALFCRNEVAAKAVGKSFPDDYTGLRFANNSGFKVGGDAFDLLVGQGRIVLEEVASTELNLRKLAAGKVDCYINDRDVVAWEWSRLMAVDTNLKNSFAEIGELSREEAYLGLTNAQTFPFQADFVRRFNERLAEIKASGELDRIVAETFAEMGKH